MTLVARTTWALLLALVLATVLLVPRNLDYTFPAESTGNFIILETVVDPGELLALAEQHGVEIAQIRWTTDAEGTNGTTIAAHVIEVLGHDVDDSVRPSLTSVFTEAPIVYTGHLAQGPALGGWYVIGGETHVRDVVDTVVAQWGGAIGRSGVLVPGTATQELMRSPIGSALFLTLLAHTLATASVVLARPAPLRSSMLSGRSRSRLLIRLLKTAILSADTWVLLPLGTLGLIIAYDIHANALLSVHRLMTEIIVIDVLATLITTVVGTTIGWAVLALTSTGRDASSSALSPRVRMVPGALLCVVAVSMTWSFASTSGSGVSDILVDQALRRQAQAQDSLPAGYSLSIRAASNPAYDRFTPHIDSFVKAHEATNSLVLAWVIPDGTTPDASGPPRIFLNNTAASHYGLETVHPHEIALYRPQQGTEDDATLTARLAQRAMFEAELGGQVATPTITIHDLEQAAPHLPPFLPDLNPYFLDTDRTTSDCLVLVIPDGYFGTPNYLSALSVGAAVITDTTQEQLLTDLRAHHLSGLVARIDAVGGGHTASIDHHTDRLVLDVLVLVASGVAAIVCTGAATRSWVQAHQRQRRIGRLLGGRTGHSIHLVPVLLVLTELAILGLLMLLAPATPLVFTLGTCAGALIGAAVVGHRAVRLDHSLERPHHG